VVILRSLARSLVYRVPGECERCPACGSPRLYELDLLTLRRSIEGRKTGFVSGCDECGLVFSNPQPSAAELARLYSPDGEWGRLRAEPEPAADGHDDKPRGTRWARMFDPIRDALPVTSPPPGAAVMDFGCGPGRLLDSMQERGWSTFGIEPAMDHAFRRHRGLDVVPDVPTFDLIVANHVLEHTPDPLALLRQFAAAARPGAFLCVTVPRLDTLPVHRDYKYVLKGHVHITAYTWPCLETLLARAGWSPVAPPPEEISKGGGRRTRSRLRVIARRVEGAIAAPPAPAQAARASLRGYYKQQPRRPLLERMGLFRLAAVRTEARRRRAWRAAKISAAEAVSNS
jgi:SAM-dependent methyltransferase